MTKKAAFFIHLSMSLLALAQDPVPPKAEAVKAAKRLKELDDSELQKLIGQIKPVKELVGEVDPVLEVGEYVELQSASDLLHVDPETGLIYDSVSRCQLRVDFAAFKELAKAQKRDTSDGLILSPFYKDKTTVKRLIQISGSGVPSWENAQDPSSNGTGTPSLPTKLTMTYPLDDSRGILKELVCTYTADEKDIGTAESLADIARITKDKILQTDIMSTLRSPERLRFLTPKEGRASNPVIGDGESAKDKAARTQLHI